MSKIIITNGGRLVAQSTTFVVRGLSEPDPGPVTYSENILDLSPSGYYKLDETSGTILTDSSPPESTDGDVISSGLITLGEPPLVTDSGHSILMNADGSNYLSFNPGLLSIDNSGLDARTITCWFRTVDSVGPLVTGRHSTNSSPTLAVYVGNAGVFTEAGKIKVIVRDNNSAGLLELTSAATFNDGNIHFCCFVLNRVLKSMELYIDGNLVASGNHSMTNSLTTDKVFAGIDGNTLGGNPHGGYNGSIDHVAFFSSGLTDTEIQELYTVGTA